MRVRFGEFQIEGAAHAGGFDLSLSRDFTHPTHEYTIPRQLIAIYWARGCDCGFFIRRICDLRHSFTEARS
jgi:hypothetical protein